MYAITAQLLTSDGDYTGSKQIPTFYLDERVQGIVSEEHARRIAWSILDPLNTQTFIVHIEKV